jgi:hypothetical protein
MNRKTLINILNNYDGIVAKEVSKEEYDNLIIEDTIPVLDDIKGIIIKKSYYPDYEGCKWLITYKILAEIKVKSL